MSGALQAVESTTGRAEPLTSTGNKLDIAGLISIDQPVNESASASTTTEKTLHTVAANFAPGFRL